MARVNLSIEIGKLQADVRALSEHVQSVQDTSTREHRIVHDIVVATSEAVRNLTAVVSEMKPLTDDYREKRAEARGAATLMRWLYVTGGGLVAAGAVKLMDAFSVKPHP